MENQTAERLKNYTAWWEAFAPASPESIAEVFHPDIRFCDPFNDVTGHAALRAVLTDALEKIESPRFTVLRVSETGDWAHIRWRFEGRMRALGGRPWTVEGMSEVRFAPDGRAALHIDHWDAAEAFYARIPVVGAVLRFIRRRAGAG